MEPGSTNISAPPPSVDLNREVLAGFIRQGRTLASYCRENGLSRHHAHDALVGRWTGPTADRLRRQLHEAAGADR